MNKPTNSRQTRGGEGGGARATVAVQNLTLKADDCTELYIEVCDCGADRTRSKWPSLEKFTRLVAGSAL